MLAGINARNEMSLASRFIAESQMVVAKVEMQ